MNVQKDEINEPNYRNHLDKKIKIEVNFDESSIYYKIILTLFTLIMNYLDYFVIFYCLLNKFAPEL